MEPPLTPVPERRLSPRYRTVEEHGISGARVRPGQSVVLLDVSATGALVETGCRLLPGSGVELLLATSAARLVIRGFVRRCVVADVRPGAVAYHGAVEFTTALPWIPSPRGKADARGEGAAESRRPAREAPTPEA